MSELVPVLKEPERKRKGSRKLLTVLFLLFVILLSVLFFNSSISKITTITIEGAQYISKSDIQAATGIAAGDAYFGVSESKVESRLTALKPIQEAVVAKSFPGNVKITVKEFPIVAFELSASGEMTAIMSNGTNVSALSDEFLMDKPVLSGWKQDDPNRAELTKQLGKISEKQLSDLSEIIPYPSKAYPDRIKIYTRTKFEVTTAVSLLAEKIEALNAVIETQEPGKITMLLADTYVPFISNATENMESDQKETTQ
ncbi:cell division protein FtsQ [Paenibacillus catalpae]|uniref:Cell division protein DivIB n=1 Tax=Paenibacillus catalpae TaxID=1045775 RepID=A0A1I1TLG5_9BACL|nr:FtsQ-type POTRA domain-containing protein [Paenibacillus catalpae]SFD59349.1 cell division protein FtsQ [Paenibacillus catalpae]